jgi:hypothetical protein
MKTRREKERKEKRIVRPKAIPSLTKEQFKVVTMEMKRTPSKVDYERVERVREIMKNCQP